MRADAVRGERSRGRSPRASFASAAAGAGDAGLRVDDDAVRLDRTRERRERELRGRSRSSRDSRSAAHRRERPPAGRSSSPRASPAADAQAVPVRIERLVLEPVRAERSTTTAPGGGARARPRARCRGMRTRRLRLLPAPRRSAGRRARARSGGRRVRRSRLAAERAEPSADHLEQAGAGAPVQRLLAGVPGGAEDRDGRHGRILCDRSRSMQISMRVRRSDLPPPPTATSIEPSSRCSSRTGQSVPLGERSPTSTASAAMPPIVRRAASSSACRATAAGAPARRPSRGRA